MNKITVGLVALFGCLGVNNALAASQSTSLINTADVVSECKLFSPGSVSFGVYDPVSTHRTVKPTTTFNINYECALPLGGTIRISLGAGNNPLAYSTPFPNSPTSKWDMCKRRMRGHFGDYLIYTIDGADTSPASRHRDSAHGGCVGTVGTDKYNSAPQGEFTYTASIVDNVNSVVRSGLYHDTLNIEIHF